MDDNSTGHEPGDNRIYSSNVSCKVIATPNSSISLAHGWENVPESCLFYSLIGTLLFIPFLIFTYKAWNRNYSRDDNINMGIIDFLFGYRDPDQWYIIPRLEFVRRQDRRHKHDLDTPNFYLPPKLPLASPIELIADEGEGEDVHSTIESSKGKTHKPSLKTKQKEQSLAIKDADKKKLNKSSPISPKSPVDVTSIPSGSHLVSHGTDSTGSIENNPLKSAIAYPRDSKDVAGHNIIIPSNHSDAKLFKTPTGKPAPLSEAFFYPSILTAEQLQASYICRALNRFFARFFKVTDADIIFTKGIDAYEYLLFQRHLILIMFVATFLCIGVILPVHWFSGELVSPAGVVNASFQRTTIKNMNQDSNLYVVHIICSLVIFSVSIVSLKSYRDSTIMKNGNGLSRRTLLVGNLPVDQRNRSRLAQVIKEYFPKSYVSAIQFVYNTEDLYIYQGQLDVAIKAKEYCLYYKKRHGKDLMVKPTEVNEPRRCLGYCRVCSCCYLCCCQWPRETELPGLVYYSQREAHLRELIKKTCEHLVKSPTECAFVTFKTHRQAKRVLEDLTRIKEDAIAGLRFHRDGKHAVKRINTNGAKVGRSSETGSEKANDPLDPKNNPHVRSIRFPNSKKADSNTKPDEKHHSAIAIKGPNGNIEAGLDSREPSIIGPVGWSVRYAPHPDNVEYDDLLYIAHVSTWSTILIHLLMFVIFLFFTTPNVILSVLEKYSVFQKMKGFSGSALWQLMTSYAPTIIAVATTGLLPVVVWHVSNQLPYEDTGSKNHSIMWKVYLFLVLMVIIMPSIGMTAAQALILGGSEKIKLECLFPTDNGAYYINYVVSSALASNMVELLKPMEFVKYYFILWTGRSIADFEAGRQTLVREFSVSMHHTSVMLIFSVAMTYAISCPLIAPFGLLYLLIKHAIDHYNLYYTYYTKKVDQNTQRTVETFVRCSLLLMFFQTTVAIQINAGIGPYSLMAQVIFWMTCMSFFINCFCDYTSRSMSGNRKARHQHEFCACFYLPRVFDDLLRENAIPENCISRQHENTQPSLINNAKK